MLPRVLVRIRRHVRRVAQRNAGNSVPDGLQNELEWQAMLDRVAEDERARELAQRMRRAEDAMARLNLQ